MTDANMQAATTSSPSVPFFRKRKPQPASHRKRHVSPPGGGSSSSSGSNLTAGPSTSAPAISSSVVLPTRRQGPSLLSAGTKRPLRGGDNGTEDFGADDEPEREGPDVKWTAAGSHQAFAQEILAGDEAEEILARRNKKTKLNGDVEEESSKDDGLYHGQGAYKSHIRKNQEVPKAMRVGPQRSTTGSTIKTVTIVDYQPDVCKDYKETGYCGFGDTCKFLHDRGTYLAGWQLDKFAAQPKRQVGESDDESGSDSDEDIPFACLICRKPYTDPVVTRCGHYFCSACAIKRFAKTPKCLACGTPTAGIFNRADKVIAKLKKKGTEEAEEREADGGDDADGQGVRLEGLEQVNGREEGEEEGEEED